MDEELSRNSETVDQRDENATNPPSGLQALTPINPGTPGQSSQKSGLVDRDCSKRASNSTMANKKEKVELEDKFSLSGSDENESQMFKELFQPSNKQGIGGVSVSVTSRDGKSLSQNRSKKDLKNKFQSSSATYYNQDLEHEPAIQQNIKTVITTQDENDKENKKTKVYKLSGNIDQLKKKSAGTVQYSDLIEDEE